MNVHNRSAPIAPSVTRRFAAWGLLTVAAGSCSCASLRAPRPRASLVLREAPAPAQPAAAKSDSKLPPKPKQKGGGKRLSREVVGSMALQQHDAVAAAVLADMLRVIELLELLAGGVSVDTEATILQFEGDLTGFVKLVPASLRGDYYNAVSRVHSRLSATEDLSLYALQLAGAASQPKQVLAISDVIKAKQALLIEMDRLVARHAGRGRREAGGSSPGSRTGGKGHAAVLTRAEVLHKRGAGRFRGACLALLKAVHLARGRVGKGRSERYFLAADHCQALDRRWLRLVLAEHRELQTQLGQGDSRPSPQEVKVLRLAATVIRDHMRGFSAHPRAKDRLRHLTNVAQDWRFYRKRDLARGWRVVDGSVDLIRVLKHTDKCDAKRVSY